MKKLQKIDSLAEFAQTYDAGGYFWSPFTRPGDGEITAGEVAMQAGRLHADSVALLQFEMHLDGLRPAERDEALRMLDGKMRARRERSLPIRTTPAGFAGEAPPLKTAIVTGVAEPVAEPLEFASGLAMLVPTLGTPIPVRITAGGRFAVWRLVERAGAEAVLVASEGLRKPLPVGRIHVGGMVAEATSKRDAWVEKCLLAHFYMEA
ncbi:MAG: hypothetical protein AAB074_06430 [Planctomycetota bacterium]